MVLSCLFVSGRLFVRPVMSCLMLLCVRFWPYSLISALVPPEWDDGCDRMLGKTKLHAYGDHYKNQGGVSEYRHPYDFGDLQQRRL